MNWAAVMDELMLKSEAEHPSLAMRTHTGAAAAPAKAPTKAKASGSSSGRW